MPTTAGLLLAAGAGRRMGRPKALVDGWLSRAVGALADCDHVVVVLGAGAGEARRLLADHEVSVVVADDWAQGLSASLAAGLHHLIAGEDERCLVSLVDLPDVGTPVTRRLLAQPGGAATLARATYARRPGHPVLLGRDHWAGVLATASGDSGARTYLVDHGVVEVECGDLAGGVDVDGDPDRP